VLGSEQRLSSISLRETSIGRHIDGMVILKWIR